MISERLGEFITFAGRYHVHCVPPGRHHQALCQLSPHRQEERGACQPDGGDQQEAVRARHGRH